MKPLFKFLPVLIIVLFTLFLSGCVNLEQKTHVNSDGSGSMKIRYWTKSSNIFGDEINSFGFTEVKVRKNYTSSNTKPADIYIEKDATPDSLSIVTLNFKFNDLNSITDAYAFKNITASWEKNSDGAIFKYTLLQDTTSAKQYGMEEYKLHYEFEFPGEVISTNGVKNGTTVSWDYSVADLVNDVVMTAIIKK
jgi:hypothetical protein